MGEEGGVGEVEGEEDEVPEEVLDAHSLSALGYSKSSIMRRSAARCVMMSGDVFKCN